MLNEIIKEQTLVRLTLKGNRYEGIFLAEQKIKKIKLEDKFPSIWIQRYHWKGKGIIKDRKTGKEQEIFLNTPITNPGGLKENIIYFDKYLREQRITNYAAIIDLQLEAIYKESKKRDEKITIYLKPLKVEELIKKGFVKNAKKQFCN